MSRQYIKTLLEGLYNELNIDPTDEEYTRYLEEKIYIAYRYQQQQNLSNEEFTNQIRALIPDFINQYKRIKQNISQISESLDSAFGISINFELIDLFEIAKKCVDSEKFIELRDNYFQELEKDPRFQGFNHIFPGLESITYEEINRIYNHIINDVDCITPEWAGKMRCIIDIRKPLFKNGNVNMEIFDFQYLDKLAKFARDNNIKLRMHNIIWHKDFRSSLDAASPDQVYQFLEVYMSQLSSRYSDVFYAVDILNEIASDTPDQVLRDSKWKDKLGDNYYIEILKIAKKYFPNTELYYNEYGEENSEKRKNILEIIRRIQEVEQREGIILLDGIGIQAHYSCRTPDNAIKSAYRDYAKTGKKLQITELDVSNDGKHKNFDYQTNRVFRTVLDCATSHNIKMINIWGVSSNISWKSKKINNYLDKYGNHSKYSKKIINAYSSKRKFKKHFEINNQSIKHHQQKEPITIKNKCKKTKKNTSIV